MLKKINERIEQQQAKGLIANPEGLKYTRNIITDFRAEVEAMTTLFNYELVENNDELSDEDKAFMEGYCKAIEHVVAKIEGEE